MSGYSRIYVVGGLGGFEGADGVNPIEFLILVGDADRQWLEPHYFSKSIKPLGKIRRIIPAGPDHADSLLDACLAFCPQSFKLCPSLAAIESALAETDCLDFHASPLEIPAAWASLREEARLPFASMNIWGADLVPIERK